MFILFVVVFILLLLFPFVVVFKARCQLSHEEENTHADTHRERETDRRTHTYRE